MAYVLLGMLIINTHQLWLKPDRIHNHAQVTHQKLCCLRLIFFHLLSRIAHYKNHSPGTFEFRLDDQNHHGHCIWQDDTNPT